ncbi:MAG: hypothetical protein AAGB46_14720 [Verrucomicrobiota bacterium]
MKPHKYSRQPLLLILLLTLLPIASKAETYVPKNPKSDEALLNASMSALDLFMQAGRTQDIYNAARWMSEYDIYPPRAINRSQMLLKKNRQTFETYLSVKEDVYGYEISKSPLRTKVHIEGAIQTEGGFTGEYSATLIYKYQRWRIKSIDID